MRRLARLARSIETDAALDLAVVAALLSAAATLSLLGR